MSVANILILSSLLILLFIIINGCIHINKPESFRDVGFGGRGGGWSHGGGGAREHRGNHGRGYFSGGGSGGWWTGGWWNPYFWNSWYPSYDYGFNYGYGNGYEYWRQCPQGSWCPPYIDCNSPECN